MAIDPNLLVLKPVSELETVNNPTTGSLLFYDGGDKLKKTNVSDFYNAMQSAYLGIATTTTTPPATGAYWYRVDTAGTYTNFKDSSNAAIVVSAGDLNGNDVTIEVKDNVATKRVKAIPTPPLTTVLDPLNEIKAVTGKAVGDYLDSNFESTFIDKYEAPPTYDYVSTTLYDEKATKSNYSSLVNTNTAHYNILNIATQSGKLVEIKVWAMVAGTMRVVVGTNDYTQAERFSVRAEVGVFNLSVGSNTLTIDFDILANERVAINGGTATIAYANYTYEVGNKYVQSYTNSDTLPLKPSGYNCILFQTTFQYMKEGVIKDRLDKEYFETVEQNVVDSYNKIYPDEIVTQSESSLGATSAYSVLSNLNQTHFNLLNTATANGEVTRVKFTCSVGGTIGIRTAIIDLDALKRAEFTSEVITLDVVAGENDIELVEPLKITKGERVVIYGGTATITYNKLVTDGNRYIAAYTTQDLKPLQGALNRPMAMAVTFSYKVESPLKEQLEQDFVKKEEYNPNEFAKAVTRTEINVSTANGANAIQNALNSITDNSSQKRYTINVDNGLYKIDNANDYLGNIENNYPAMIVPKDYVDIVGKSKSSTILWAELPHDDTVLASQTSLGREKFQTIWGWANESKISNITFIAKNTRYALHQDNGNESNKSRTYENCDFIFLGNKGYLRALGIGTYSGSKTYVIGGKSSSQNRTSFSIHNNIDFLKPSLWSFKGHYFENLSGSDSGANGQMILIDNSGSMQDCTIEMINCSSNQFIINYRSLWLYSPNRNDCFNYANWRIVGSGNTPIFFSNEVAGKALMVKSLSTGLNSKVRFDIASTAYNAIISNPYNYWGVLGHPERFIQDKYVAFDGAVGLSGYAIGGKSIIEGNAGNGVAYQCSLGKRLGDCSNTNKTLGIIIDGTTYNVVFNKNYTAMTNAQIITEINDVIGSVATASEYNIGGDYYAEFTDVLYQGVNASTSAFIPKGTLVTMKNNRLSPCGETDVLFGLAIDDIPPYRLDSEGVIYGKGRVIKNCYITIESDKIQSVLNSGTGSKYKIANGSFVADVNGSYSLIDNKYLKI